jgi:DNA-binding CsgD family transcriptional regulator
MARPAPFLQSGVTLHRARRTGDYDEEAQRMIAVLFRHMERSLDISFRLGALGNVNASSLNLLDHAAGAVFLFDDRGRVIFTNHAASDVLEADEGVEISNGHLSLMRASDNKTLQRLIALVLHRAETEPPGGVMVALRPSGRRPFVVTVSPLPGSRFPLATVHPAGCVVFTDPDRTYEPAVEHLRSLYRLTPSESRLAVRIANGDDLKGAAAELGVSYGTARTQLTSIFRKTGTGRQGQLVKLLVETLPALMALIF